MALRRAGQIPADARPISRCGQAGAIASSCACTWLVILASRSQASARPSPSRRRSEAFPELPLGAGSSSVEPLNPHL